MEQTTQTAQPIFPPRQVAQGPEIGSITPLTRPWNAIFATAAVFIALIALFVAYFMDVRYLAQARGSEAKIVTLTAQLQEGDLVAAEREMTKYASAINGYQAAVLNQRDHSALLRELDLRTPKDAIIDSVSMDEKGMVKLLGRTNSFLTVAKAYLSFKGSSLVKNVTLNDTSLGDPSTGQKINFTITGIAQLSSTDVTTQSADENERTGL